MWKRGGGEEFQSPNDMSMGGQKASAISKLYDIECNVGDIEAHSDDDIDDVSNAHPSIPPPSPHTQGWVLVRVQQQRWLVNSSLHIY